MTTRFPSDDKRYWRRTLRQLPLRVAPIRGELLVSYIRRLASANRVETKLLLRHLAGHNGSGEQAQLTASHDVAINLPVLARLALLSGCPEAVLSTTLSIRWLHAPDEEPRRAWLPLAKEPRLIRPCSRCTARHGSTTPAVVRLDEQQLPICMKHDRTLASYRTDQEREHPLAPAPEILTAARRLQILRRRHHRSINQALDVASTIIHGWQNWSGQNKGRPDIIRTRWRDRAARLANVPYGVIQLQDTITRLPEIVAVTALFCWNPALMLTPRGEPDDPSPIQFLLHITRSLDHSAPSQMLRSAHPLFRWANVPIAPDFWWRATTEPDKTIYLALTADQVPSDDELAKASSTYRRLRSTRSTPHHRKAQNNWASSD